jgi:endonuclease YncB( thermonuclease family)
VEVFERFERKLLAVLAAGMVAAGTTMHMARGKSAPTSDCYDATVVRVVDGDTFQIQFHPGLGVHIDRRCRLLGFDAPEIRTVAGVKAKALAHKHLAGATKVCTDGREGKYGRLLVSMPGLVEALEKAGLKKWDVK